MSLLLQPTGPVPTLSLRATYLDKQKWVVSEARRTVTLLTSLHQKNHAINKFHPLSVDISKTIKRGYPVNYIYIVSHLRVKRLSRNFKLTLNHLVIAQIDGHLM